MLLLWNGLLVLFVLLAGFPWNMTRPQLHLLSLTVKKLRCQASYFILRSQNIQYKTHPEFWPLRWIFKTSLYYKTRLIFENWRYIIFNRIIVIDGWGISCEIALIWMSLDFTDDQSALVQVMAWCRQATSHYLSQCWPKSLLLYGVTRPEWVNWCYWISFTRYSL